MYELPDIRRATQADLEGCAEVINEWLDQTDWLPRTASTDEIAEMFRSALKTRVIWVGGEPVAGYLSIDPSDNHIWGFYCRETGRGLGKALLEHVKVGRDFLSLNTHVPNERAQRFYKREGFVEVDRFIPKPPDTVEEVRMEWHRDA